ncbi:hypothetical protein SE19_05875, partial [Acidiplasma aeolicum]
MLLNKIGEANIYKMLSDETRLKILKLLSSESLSVSGIINKMGMDQPLISHKLKDLRENGLVISYRSGKNIIYKISDDSLRNLLRAGSEAGKKIERICKCAECDE